MVKLNCRYGPAADTSDIGNCLLSDKNSFDLSDQDLVSTAAGDWDVYEVRSDILKCQREQGPSSSIGGGSSSNGKYICDELLIVRASLIIIIIISDLSTNLSYIR
mgnify:CR=1 FL=1